MKHKNKSNLLVIIILCLPIILIGILFIKYYNHNNATSSISNIYISLHNGETMSLSGENFKLYTDIYYNCQKTDSLPEKIEDKSPLTIMYVINDVTNHYDLYFTNDYKKSFFVTENKEYYIIDNEHTKTLALRPEFSYIYPNYTLPTLTLNKGMSKETILPIDYNWSFFKADGIKYDDLLSDIQKDTPEKFIIHASDINKFEFSVKPDYLNVTYYDELGNIIKTTDNINEIKIDASGDVKFSISIDAKWTSTNNATGDAKYSINLLYDLPEKFTLSSNSVKPGNFLIIKAEQFDLDEDIIIDSDLKYFNLKFIKYNNETFAFVPIDSRNIAKEYYINLTVNNNLTELKFNVEHMDFGVDFYNPDKILSDSSTDELDELYSIINSSNETILYFKQGTPFASPIKGEVFFNYGKEIFASSGPTSYFVQGIEYKVKGGTKVKSTESGIVCYVGENEKLGKMIVIDHGLGVKSYYAHLDQINVSVGTLVQKNITIATSGDSGYTIDDMFYFAVSINGTFIDPNLVLNNGLKLS